MVKEYNKNIETLNKYIEETQNRTNTQLSNMENEFKGIQLQHEKDMRDAETKFDESVKQAEQIIYEQDNNNKKMNQTIEDLKSQLNINDNNHKKDLSSLEEKVEQLAVSAKNEQNKFQQFRSEKNNETDNMARHYRELTRELSLKTEVIDELTREKEDLRTSIKELQ